MTRYQGARALSALAALGFFLAAVLQISEYRIVMQHAQQGFSGLVPLVATLWLVFAAAMIVLGAIVCLIPFGRVTGARWILAFAGCFPLITVLLQLMFLGFTAPSALLLAVAVASYVAAIVFPRTAGPATVGAA